MVVYQNDHIGTPQKITAVNGAVVWSAKYDSFGKATIDYSSTIENNLRFPGQYFDEESGLHYNWNRYYDSKAGRYLKADPIGLTGGINLYVYVNGKPVNAMDPWGLTGLEETFPILFEFPELAPILAPIIPIIIVLYPSKIAEDEYPPPIFPPTLPAEPLPGDEFVNPDGTVDDSAGVDNDCDKKGKYKCEGYSSYDQVGTPKHVRRGSTRIIAYGKTELIARDAWIKKAQNAAPRGFTARHIEPTCKKIR